LTYRALCVLMGGADVETMCEWNVWGKI